MWALRDMLVLFLHLQGRIFVTLSKDYLIIALVMRRHVDLGKVMVR